MESHGGSSGSAATAKLPEKVFLAAVNGQLIEEDCLRQGLIQCADTSHAVPAVTNSHHLVWGGIDNASSSHSSSESRRAKSEMLDNDAVCLMEGSSESNSIPEEFLDFQCGAELSERILNRIPRGGDGQLTSVGSINHEFGTCSPCAFAARPKGCLHGVNCNFCHLLHDKEKLKTRKAVRPCKGQRKRYKEFWDGLRLLVDQNPVGFDPTKIELPPAINADEQKRTKFADELKEYQLKKISELQALKGHIGKITL